MRQAPRDVTILTAVATFSVVGRAERISLKRAPINKQFNRSFGSEIAQSDRSKQRKTVGDRGFQGC